VVVGGWYSRVVGGIEKIGAHGEQCAVRGVAALYARQCAHGAARCRQRQAQMLMEGHSMVPRPYARAFASRRLRYYAPVMRRFERPLNHVPYKIVIQCR